MGRILGFGGRWVRVLWARNVMEMLGGINFDPSLQYQHLDDDILNMKFSKNVSSPMAFGLTAATLLNGIAGVLAFTPPQVFENTRFTRSIDLTGSYVKESVLLEVKNVGNQPESTYFYAVGPALKDHIGVIEGREKKSRLAAVTVQQYGEEDSKR